MYGIADGSGGPADSRSSENVSVVERQRLLHHSSSGMPTTTCAPFSVVEDVTDSPINRVQIFDIGLCIVDFFMVFKGGFGFHVADIITRFGPETIVTFSKVRCPPAFRPSPKELSTVSQAYTSRLSASQHGRSCGAVAS